MRMSAWEECHELPNCELIKIAQLQLEKPWNENLYVVILLFQLDEPDPIR